MGPTTCSWRADSGGCTWRGPRCRLISLRAPSTDEEASLLGLSIGIPLAIVVVAVVVLAVVVLLRRRR
jgi:hypothetical protein